MALSTATALSEQPPRRRVKQLSSIRASPAFYSMANSYFEDGEPITTYQSFTDLRKLLDEECAEIERREREAKRSLEARIQRRHSEDMPGTSGSAGLMGSLKRLIDPLLAMGGSSSSSSDCDGSSTPSRRSSSGMSAL
ncbi:hypothetical protein EC988_007916 [Linderina pennispora]|nr:hypothetical protein EC988_007916 [Linderina pennispora]